MTSGSFDRRNFRRTGLGEHGIISARDGSKLAHSREITWVGGKKMQSGPPAGTGGGN